LLFLQILQQQGDNQSASVVYDDTRFTYFFDRTSPGYAHVRIV
jgi:hypothetical protein